MPQLLYFLFELLAAHLEKTMKWENAGSLAGLALRPAQVKPAWDLFH